jgi:hypothetical protein
MLTLKSAGALRVQSRTIVPSRRTINLYPSCLSSCTQPCRPFETKIDRLREGPPPQPLGVGRHGLARSVRAWRPRSIPSTRTRAFGRSRRRRGSGRHSTDCVEFATGSGLLRSAMVPPMEEPQLTVEVARTSSGWGTGEGRGRALWGRARSWGKSKHTIAPAAGARTSQVRKLTNAAASIWRPRFYLQGEQQRCGPRTGPWVRRRS